MKKVIIVKKGYSYNEVAKALQLVAKYAKNKENNSPPLVLDGIDKDLVQLIIDTFKTLWQQKKKSLTILLITGTSERSFKRFL